MTIFNEMDFRLSVVKRWAVVNTIRSQSVAEHSFNVAILAERIARKWFGLNKPHDLYYLYRFALAHDAHEAMTSDIPSYMKRYVAVDDAAVGFADMFNEIDTSLPTGYAAMFRAIVKMADYIDAAIFLRMEISHGNKSVQSILNDLEDRFQHYLDTLIINDMPVGKSVFRLYQVEIIDGLFKNDQFVAEGFRF